MATFVKIDTKAAVLLSGAAGVLAAFAIAPSESASMVTQILEAITGMVP